MTDAEILTAIKNTPELKAMAVAGRDLELANDSRLAEVSKRDFRLSAIHVLETLGMGAGATAMTALRAITTGANAAIVRELLLAMGPGGIGWNIGDDQAPAVLTALVTAGVFNNTQRDALLALGSITRPQDPGRITRILAPFRTGGQVGGDIV